MNNKKLLLIENFIDKDYLNLINEWLEKSVPEYHIEGSRSPLGTHNVPRHLFNSFQNLYKNTKKTIENFYNTTFYEEHFCNIVEYVKGDYLELHTDDESQYDGDKLLSQAKTSNGHPRRDFSSVLYFNDTYSGGQIEFPHLAIKFKPSPGTLIAFPAGTLFSHEVLTITSGRRWVTPSFWCVKD